MGRRLGFFVDFSFFNLQGWEFVQVQFSDRFIGFCSSCTPSGLWFSETGVLLAQGEIAID